MAIAAGVDGRLPPSAAVAGLVVSALQRCRASVAALEGQVAAGQLVPKFGEQAYAIVTSATEHAGRSAVPGAASNVAASVSGVLEWLWLRQIQLLRQQLVAVVEPKVGQAPGAELAALADRDFVARAQELKMPGSSWDFEQERYRLRSELEMLLNHQRDVAREKASAALARRQSAELVARLQSQTEALQARMEQLRAGSPPWWSASYRIPGTPLQLVGRYQQGHVSAELGLSQDRDPANAAAGMVEGVGPMNLGVSVSAAA